MMDKVTAGFEKQLDNLYQNDMLDITSDIAAMEQMMVKDGLSDDGELKFLERRKAEKSAFCRL